MSAETPHSPAFGVAGGAVGAVPSLSGPAMERLPRAFGKFALKRRLARGGMADVFLASLSGAQGFEKELVVKLIRPELAADEGFVRRFVDEAKTCVRLTHPNIVSIFELGVETGVLYLAMELVRGATLAEVLHEGGALTPEEGAFVALEVARALDHAHRRSVIHRDVTPGNVMIDEEGSVKLLDFGIAAPAGLDVEVFGTPGHMPPEQIEGGALTGAVDLFALGTVMMETWTGRPPYRRADARSSRTALLEGPPPPPSSTSTALASLEGLDELAVALLARQPSARPQHADDVARTLRSWLREQNADLDEVARTLAKRVSRATTARDAREAGRPVAGAPMAKTMRPTPLADATKTFATRGDLTSWRGPVTRRLDDDAARERASAVPPTSTRKMEEGAPPARALPPAEAKLSKRSGTLTAVVSLLAIAAIGAAWTLGRARGRDGQTQPNDRATGAADTGVIARASASNVEPRPLAAVSAPASASSAVAASTMPTTSSAAPFMVVTARLIVTSSPPSAVELDGRSVGVTPVSVVAPFGDHRVTLRPRGLGESFERGVTLTAGAGAEVHGDFNDEPLLSVHAIGPR